LSGPGARRAPSGRPGTRVRRTTLVVALAGVALVLAATAVVLGPVLARPADPAAGEPATATESPASRGPGSAGASGPAGPPPSAVAGLGRSPAPKPSPARPPSSSGFPDASSTGVPSGTRLTTYTGPCTITANNTVIDAKTVNCNLAIHAKGVIIKRSKINGNMGTEEGTAHSYTLQDSEVDAGVYQGAALGSTNMTVLRSDIHGGQTSVYCYANCTIRDSYLHGQRLPDGVDWHLGAFLANDNGNDPGGRTNAVLIHNTIACDATPNSSDGGCSGDINLYGDFGPITYVTLDNNLFGANPGLSYCVYGGSSAGKPYSGQAEHVVVVNNVFRRGPNRKCGAYGAVTAFDPARPGNQWTNNVWDDGAPVPPEK
jgi:hypothetical protein